MKKTLIIIVFLALAANMQAQTEMWVKLSPEIRMNIDNTPLEFRWRPVDVTFLPEQYGVPNNRSGRTDIMLGANIWKLKVFSYSKFYENGGAETGLRLDYNFALFEKKLLVNIQERLFWALNAEGDDHYYLIQYVRYKVAPKVTTGILSYGKWKMERNFNEGNWFMGPSVDVVFAKNFNLLLALTKDIFHEPVYMTFIRIGYRFKLNNN